ncbi:MAG: hypothetical protein QOF71_1043 [Candidatus Eremiobacteraeota bacterium]|jgi:hypothetical protein|nr:hypothetical protein [Candidatus Eremiobacteraeota bacterium]
MVTGDILLEWRFARSRILHATGTPSETGYYMQCTREEGGAEALGRLIKRGAEESRLSAEVYFPDISERRIEPGNPPYWHTYMLCAPYAEPATGDASVAGDDRVWRVQQRVGHDRQPVHAPAQPGNEPTKHDPDDWQSEEGKADVVVIEDTSYGFGPDKDDKRSKLGDPDPPNDADPQSLWPESLKHPRRGAWAIIRWKQKPEGDSSKAVLKHVAKQFAGRVILIVNADDLRKRRLRISRELTWERTIEDLADGLRTGWADEFRKCNYLVVSFFGAGAAVFKRISTGGGRVRYDGRLYFDPLRLQETWAQEYHGSMFGYTRCVTAAVTLQLLRILAETKDVASFDPERMNVASLGNAIMPGLHAQHVLLRQGFAVQRHEIGFPGAVPNLTFPIERVACALAMKFERGKPLPELNIPVEVATPEDAGPAQDGGPKSYLYARRYVELAIPSTLDGKPADTDQLKWKILRERHSQQDDILREARRIVEDGVEGGDPKYEYPIAKFGELLLTDRTEIESYTSIASLILNYMHVRKAQKPVSIAVFGDPGSGKSFGIKAVAKHVADRLSMTPRHELTHITFNLSQLSSPSAINDALHQVRDAGLTGKLPLVFWDEFDTALKGVDLGWLRYFLAPMQDGTFQEGPVTHNVGRAIFVFGGGINRSMREFKATARRIVGKRAKASDFVSRLSGHVDVLGLNHPVVGKLDAAVAFRRAVLLRALLKECSGELEQTIYRDGRLLKIINVDPGLVYAFLSIGSYDYAARSMSAIVAMSGLTGRATFERSSLAPSEQILTHVDAREFIRLVEVAPEWFLEDRTRFEVKQPALT